MNVSDWISIGAVAAPIVAGVIGWLIRIERRHATYMTRDEHKEILAEQNARVEKSIDRLSTDIERRHQENRNTQDRIFDRLDSIADRVGASKEAGG